VPSSPAVRVRREIEAADGRASTAPSRGHLGFETIAARDGFVAGSRTLVDRLAGSNPLLEMSPDVSSTDVRQDAKIETDLSVWDSRSSNRMRP
jgi:hypothetical protein